MSRQLVVKRLEDGVLGTVSVTAEGQVVVGGETPEFERALNEVVQTLLTRRLVYRTGTERKSASGGVEFVELAKYVEPGDRDFLAALKDALIGRVVPGGRIRGSIVEEAGEGGGT